MDDLVRQTFISFKKFNLKTDRKNIEENDMIGQFGKVNINKTLVDLNIKVANHNKFLKSYMKIEESIKTDKKIAKIEDDKYKYCVIKRDNDDVRVDNLIKKKLKEKSNKHLLVSELKENFTTISNDTLNSSNKNQVKSNANKNLTLNQQKFNQISYQNLINDFNINQSKVEYYNTITNYKSFKKRVKSTSCTLNEFKKKLKTIENENCLSSTNFLKKDSTNYASNRHSIRSIHSKYNLEEAVKTKSVGNSPFTSTNFNTIQARENLKSQQYQNFTRTEQNYLKTIYDKPMIFKDAQNKTYKINQNDFDILNQNKIIENSDLIEFKLLKTKKKLWFYKGVIECIYPKVMKDKTDFLKQKNKIKSFK